MLRQLQNSVRITKCKFESINPQSLRLLGFLLLASFDIFGSTLRIVVNNSNIQEEWEKSKGAGNIRNISVRLQGRVPHLNTDSSLLSIQNYQISIDIFSIFINSFGVFKSKGFRNFVAVCETPTQYDVFLILIIFGGNSELSVLTFRLCPNTPKPIRTSV